MAGVDPAHIESKEQLANMWVGLSPVRIWSPALLHLVADVIFFLNYAIGWALTFQFQPDMVWNNNVARIFWVYNICIGVDSVPAQPVAVVIFAFYFLVYGAAVFVLWQLIGQKGSCFSKLARRSLLVAALFFTSTFFLTYGVRPDNPMLTKIHTWGFAGGLFGYALFHISLLVEYFGLGDEKLHGFKGCKAKLYFLVVVASTVFYLYMAYVLVDALTGQGPHAKDIDKWTATIDSAVFPAKITGGVPVHKPVNGSLTSAYITWDDGTHTNIGIGARGWLLVAIVAISPVFQYCLMPDNMKLAVEFIPQVSARTLTKEGGLP